MTPEFRAKIVEILGDCTLYPWQEAIIDAIMTEYEFKCPSFVYAGPGHQSRHTCTNQRPHPIEGEHYDDLYEWIGTSVEEIVGERAIGSRTYPMRHLISNAPHEGYNCACRIPSELRQ